MSDLFKVRIVGPLASRREGLAAEFLRLGYAPSTAARHLQLMAHLSIWMADHEVSVEALTWSEIDRFCSDHGLAGKHRFTPGAAPRSMNVLVDFLHAGGVQVSVPVPVDGLPVDVADLLGRFATYLRDERALTMRTTDGYLYHVRVFANWYVAHDGSGLAAVTVARVNQFLVERLTVWSAASARASRTALRAWFRWLFLIGYLDWDLAGGIVAVRIPLHTGLPRALPAAGVRSLLAVDMSRRDRAIILVLVRLGLRTSEVAGLTLDDFAWHDGTVRVQGKGGDCQYMPLPADVGEAIAGYLSGQRPAGSPRRNVFLASKAPYQPLGGTAVSAVVTRLAQRAGIEGRVGAHQLRHSAATAVLAGGGTLSEAGQLLRHRSAQATAIYAKVDQAALTSIVRPWPLTVSSDTAHE